jgi:dUTP pyrophosphatase
MVKVKVERIIEGIHLPRYQTPSSAGCDLHAGEDTILKSQGFKAVRTGLKIFLPEGYEGHVRARSGLAFKHGIGLVNGVGTLDADFRGEIKVIMINHGPEDFEIKKGDRIAQFVIAPMRQLEWDESPLEEERRDTERGEGGLGSTGI